MKKFLSVFLALAVIAAQLAFVCSAMPSVKAANINFKCGDNATWDLDENGVLTISGTGDMYNFATVAIHYEKPWNRFDKEIYSIVIEEGITDIGRSAFSSCSNLKSVYLPASLETINEYAFFSCKNIESITVAEGSFLMCIEDLSLTNTKWYINQPDNQPVYLGRMLYKYKTSSSEPFSVEVSDGTYAISDGAFYNCALKDISFPDSLASIGKDAFTGTDWLNSQPQGAVYAGNVFLKYNGSIPISQSDFVLKDGTLGIAADAFVNSSRVITVSVPQSVINIGNYAFSGCSNLEKVEFAGNSNLRYIGDEAFKYCSNLTEMILPEKSESIGENAFTASGLSSLFLHKNVKNIGYRFAYESSLTQIAVSEENPYYSSDSSGVLYNKDKTLLITAPSKVVLTEYTINENCKEIMSYAFSGVNVKKVNLNDGLEIIGDRVFEYCHIGSASIPDSVKKIGSCLFFYSGLTSIKLGKGIDTIPESTFALTGITEVTVPSNVKIIEKGAFINCFYLQKVTLLKSVEEIGKNIFEGCSYLKVYCYKNSTAYTYAVNNSIPYVLLDGTVETSEITDAISQADGIDRSLYTAESLAELDTALNAVDLDKDGLAQDEINEWTLAIKTAIENLKYAPADFSQTDTLIKQANGIDRSLYTAESLAELDTAIAAVDKTVTKENQAKVSVWNSNIENAIKNLKYAPADFSVVDALISKANKIDRSLYIAESLAELDKAVAAVDKSVTKENQAKVAGWVVAIDNAMNNLKYAPADFTAVDAALKKAQGINRSYYTSESLTKLDKAVAAVDKSVTKEKQAQVNSWASGINSAVKNLEYKPADYAQVNKAVAAANKIDLRLYSDYTVTVLKNALNSVNYNLKINEQKKVDGYASSINTAIAGLQYASVTLRHDTCGVIVSATAKEIDPDTSLAVEKVDASTYEGTNFAVGGSIKSLHFYDINLVLGGKTVQPGGTVTVKIKLADGVNPSKCKVYHVTDDKVNPLERFSSTIDGNYIVFETTHFSEFAVIEVETVVDSVEILSLPSKTEYYTGEALNTTGMTVVAHYSDGTSKAVTDFNVGMVDLSAPGTKKVTVYYTYGNITKSAVFEINIISKASGEKPVTPPEEKPTPAVSAEITAEGKPAESYAKKLSLFSLYSRASISLGCNLENADGCTLRWSSDSSKVFVDSEGKVTCKGLFGAKQAKITLEVIDSEGKVAATDTISVIFYKLSFQLSGFATQVAGLLIPDFKRK